MRGKKRMMSRDESKNESGWSDRRAAMRDENNKS